VVARPDVDESSRPGEIPRPRAERLALAKARTVAQAHPGQQVIGADQVAACEGAILTNPAGPGRARAAARAVGPRRAIFSAVALVHEQRGYSDAFVDLTTVMFRNLSEQEIEAYLAADQPYDCAGSLRSEALGISLCERIDTRSHRVMGCP
jgi:septum formation protein